MAYQRVVKIGFFKLLEPKVDVEGVKLNIQVDE